MATKIVPTAQAIIQRLQKNLSEQQAGPIKTILEVLSEELAGGRTLPQKLIQRQTESIHHLLNSEKIQFDELNMQLLNELSQLSGDHKKR